MSLADHGKPFEPMNDGNGKIFNHNLKASEAVYGDDITKKDMKFDGGKPIAGALTDFGLALMEVAKLMTYGATKYERSSWLTVEGAEQRYKDALWRHLLQNGIDPETNLGHDVAVAFNALATLQFRLLREKNNA